MKRIKIAPKAFKRFTKAVSLQIEFEKQLNDLKALIDDTEENEKINTLIAWNRNEFVKRPEMFIGDHIPIKLVRDNVAAGYSLDLAIQEAYRILKGRFALMDMCRAFEK